MKGGQRNNGHESDRSDMADNSPPPIEPKNVTKSTTCEEEGMITGDDAAKMTEKAKKRMIAGPSSSTLLRQEKQNIAYPMIQQKLKSTPDSQTSSSAFQLGGIGSHTLYGGGPELRGIGKNQGRIISRYHGNHAATEHFSHHLDALQERFQEMINTAPSRDQAVMVSTLTSWAQHLAMEPLRGGSSDTATTTRSPPVNTNQAISRLRGLRKNDQLEAETIMNRLPPEADGEIVVHPGTGMEDVFDDDDDDDVRIDHDEVDGEIMVHPGTEMEDVFHDDIETIHDETVTEEQMPEDDRPADIVQLLEPDDPPSTDTTTGRVGEQLIEVALPTNTTSPDINNDGLVEARPVEEDSCDSDMMEAQPVDQEHLDQQAIREGKDKKFKQFVCGLVAMACLVVTLSLAFRLSNKKEKDTAADYGSSLRGSARPILPMENLKFLYDELPEKTKENLYKNDSPQHMAWEWLFSHPNITSLEEWRKKQIFAMATFFYSLEGPSWPEKTPNRDRWMNATTLECSWVMRDFEVAYFTHHSKITLGSAYEQKDIEPCNERGELQTLGVHQLFLPDHLKPRIPPEIGLLTSLRILGILSSQVNAQVSDFLVPELIQLPSLEFLKFRSVGLSGSLPKDLGLMTRLRHLVIGDRSITGTIPREIGNMASLEHLILDDMEGLKGNLPSELGLMTRLTGLDFSGLRGTLPSELGLMTGLTGFDISRSSFTGHIPTELGSLSQTLVFHVGGNMLSGPVPSELGLMTSTTWLHLGNNALTGFVHSELGLMTNLVDLRLGNDLGLQGSYNKFSGFLPTELWELSHMEDLFLPNLPNLSCSIPAEIMMPNLTKFNLVGSTLFSGTIPKQTCSVRFLRFDCSDLLCGCDCLCN